MDIAEKTFLVTGGRSGLGAACAERLSSAGANVVIVDIQPDEGESIRGARFTQADVTDEAGMESAIRTAVDAFGELHGVVHCAGVEMAQLTVGKQGIHPLSDFARVVQINLIGTFNVFRLAAAVMTKNTPTADGERGVLIATSSVAAFDGQVGQAAYAASKGGIAAMVLPLARELARHGIRVVSIAPGVFDTPLLARLPDKVRQTLSELSPFPQRLGKPEEFARLAQQIIENQMLNGEVIRLDGALRMPAR